MTTSPQPMTNDAIPSWFMEFVQENARQHAELAARMAANKAELTAQLAADKAALTAQLAEFRVETTAQLAADKAELTAQLAEFRVETTEKMGDLRTEMHREFGRLMRWVVGTTAGMGIAIAGSLVYAVERLA